MGQARANGDEDSRVAAAIARLLADAMRRSGGQYEPERLFPGLVVGGVATKWLHNLKIESKAHPWGDVARRPFEHVLMYILLKQYGGACHSTSAAIFMLLSEIGLEPSLCLGEVGSRAGNFDHSWVEIDGLVLDAAVCLPLSEGAHVGGPVFASIALDDLASTTLQYGKATDEGLQKVAREVLGWSLLEYGQAQGKPSIWALTVGVAALMGLELSVEALKAKYGEVKRSMRVAPQREERHGGE